MIELNNYKNIYIINEEKFFTINKEIETENVLGI